MTLIGWIKGLHKNGGGASDGFATYEDSTYTYNGGTSTTERGALNPLHSNSYAPHSGAYGNLTAYVFTNTITGAYDYSGKGGNLDGVDVVLSVPSTSTGSFTQVPTTEETFNKGVNLTLFGNRGGSGSYASRITVSVRFD